MEIDAKVAAVLSETRIALNAGSRMGVAERDPVRFWRTVTVTDPDTNERLGDVRLVALVLTIESVQERLSVAVVPSTIPSISERVFGKGAEPVIKLTGAATKALLPGDGKYFQVTEGMEVTIEIRDSNLPTFGASS